MLPSLQRIKPAKVIELTLWTITCSLWYDWFRVFGPVNWVLYTHSINIMSQPCFLLAGGVREGHCFLSMSTISWWIVSFCPVLLCMFSDNQLVFSSSQSYVRRVNICSKHLSNVDRTGVWRHFSQSLRMGVEVVGLCLQCSVVKGLFLPVLSNISHDFILTGWQCVGDKQQWNSGLPYSPIKWNDV